MWSAGKQALGQTPCRRVVGRSWGWGEAAAKEGEHKDTEGAEGGWGGWARGGPSAATGPALAFLGLGLLSCDLGRSSTMPSTLALPGCLRPRRWPSPLSCGVGRKGRGQMGPRRSWWCGTQLGAGGLLGTGPGSPAGRCHQAAGTPKARAGGHGEGRVKAAAGQQPRLAGAQDPGAAAGGRPPRLPGRCWRLRHAAGGLRGRAQAAWGQRRSCAAPSAYRRRSSAAVSALRRQPAAPEGAGPRASQVRPRGTL